MGFSRETRLFPRTPAAMPGDDLLFHRLSDSTIGAVWFHGRVRDGIGWVTNAMATKLWGQRDRDWLDGSKSMRAPHMLIESHIAEQAGHPSKHGFDGNRSILSLMV